MSVPKNHGSPQFRPQQGQPQVPAYLQQQPGYAAGVPGGSGGYNPNYLNAGGAGSKKPVSILIFGILNLVIGFFSLGYVTWQGVILGIALNRLKEGNGFTRDSLLLVYEQMGYVQFQIGSVVLGALLTFVLIAAGILLLMGKEKGRDLSVSYSVGSIVFCLLSTSFQIFTGLTLLSSTDAPKKFAEPAGMAVMTSGILALAFLIYPTVTLICMTRKSVKDYLQSNQR